MSKLLVFVLNMVFVCIVSAIGACTVFLFTGIDFVSYLSAFLGLTALQIFIGKLWSIYIEKKLDAVIADSESRMAIADSIQHVDLECSYCGSHNSVKIILNKENKFACEACKQVNAVIIKVSVARTTLPMSESDMTTKIFKQLDSMK